MSDEPSTPKPHLDPKVVKKNRDKAITFLAIAAVVIGWFVFNAWTKGRGSSSDDSDETSCMTECRKSDDLRCGIACGETEAECRRRKKPLMDKCMPMCDVAVLPGEDYDACLDMCARKEFGEQIPMCTR